MMEEKPKNNEVIKLIGEARELIAEDMDTEAVLRLRKAIKLSPNNVDALLLYAQASPSRDNARRTLNKVLQIDANNSEARLLLKRLDKEETLESQNEQSQVSAMPTINIVNNNDNTSNAAAFGAGGGMGVVQDENKVAFWVGLIAAFFGFFGIGYMLNGKIFSGIAYLLIGGPVFIFVLVLIVGITAGVGAIVAIPLYFYGIWKHAKAGAQRDPKLVPFNFG